MRIAAWHPRRSLLVMLLLVPSATSVVVLAGCGGQTSGTGKASFYCREPEIDLGEVLTSDTDPTMATFHVMNLGGAPLEIYRITTSCGCTQVRAYPRSILPGETAKLEFELSQSRSGERSASISVVTNDPVRPTRTLAVKWSPRLGVELESAHLALGPLVPGETRERDVPIYWDGVPPECKLGDVVVESREDVVGEVVVTDTQAPRLRVRVQAADALGAKWGLVRVALEDCASRQLELRVTWEVRPVVDVRPAQLFLGPTSPTTMAAGKIVVTSARDALEVAAVRIAGDLEGTARLQRLADRSTMAEVQVMAPGEAGTFRGMIEMDVVAPVKETYRVPFVHVVAPS